MSVALYNVIFLAITLALFVLAVVVLHKCSLTLRTGSAPVLSEFAISVGQVSVVAYSLVNLAIITLLLQNIPTQTGTRESFLSLVGSIAWATLFLGLTLFLLLFIFSRLRRLEPAETGPNL